MVGLTSVKYAHETRKLDYFGHAIDYTRKSNRLDWVKQKKNMLIIGFLYRKKGYSMFFTIGAKLYNKLCFHFLDQLKYTRIKSAQIVEVIHQDIKLNILTVKVKQRKKSDFLE